MINFTISPENYKNDLEELVRPFEQRTDDEFFVHLSYSNDGEELKAELTSDKLAGFEKTYRFPFCASGALEYKREEKRRLKIALYGTLSFLTGINLPYGCLTGIRPTKLFTEMANEGLNAEEIFGKDYSVAQNKLELIKRTAETQKPYLKVSESECDVFVFIPFCPTRCAYCSFISFPMDKQKQLVEPYSECLIKEIKLLKSIVRRKGLRVRSVYVGGGTPTSLSREQLDRILRECRFGAAEFTVEAGRPDTITLEITDVMKKRGVTRVSVNPQTFNDATLSRIGRAHTSDDIFRAYELCKKKKFDVNMDLIAMLPGEKFEDFKYSLDKAAELGPENVTVHTLYLKKGSELKLSGYRHTDFDTAARMVDYACETLSRVGYDPYYMYRQKYTSGNLENVGYCKPGKECVYNIDIMEETASILAAGANAISKKQTKAIDLIERNANYKHPLEYVKHFDEVLEKQKRFWGVLLF